MEFGVGLEDDGDGGGELADALEVVAAPRKLFLEVGFEGGDAEDFEFAV